MGNRTPFYSAHLAAGARLVDFAGWEMPVSYGSQIQEHHAVRRNAGMFDVSHMTVVDLHGEAAREYLRFLLANDIDKAAGAGRAIYSCMLNPAGGVIDDLIVYCTGDRDYRMVVNAATRDKDLAWLRAQAGDFGVQIRERADLAMLAVQGPAARDAVHRVLDTGLTEEVRDLRRFCATWRGEWFVARTGYTGEDGYELMLPSDDAPGLWQSLIDEGVAPAGLGARDTLRLEAGMNLYGQDMDNETTPLESGLGWTVAWKPAARSFIGREALERQREQGVERRLVGLMLLDKGVLRSHQAVFSGDEGVGETTSGSFSPTLERSVAMARISGAPAKELTVEVRGRRLAARVVKTPFVREGRPTFNI